MQEKTGPVFVGFGRLEDWILAVERTRPVFAMPLIEKGADSGGLRTDTLLVVCQQVDAQGKVLYCRLRAASFTTCFEDPWDTDWRDREAAWRSLWAVVEEELLGKGFILQRATVAPPQGLRFLEASAACLEFDAQAKRFVRRAA